MFCLQEGINGETGHLLIHGVLYVKEKRPDSFLFENVFALSWKKHREFLDHILNALSNITEEATNTTAYLVKWKILDTCKFGGLPQSRKRIYIAGCRKQAMVAEFKWPKEIPCQSLTNFLGPPDERRALRVAGAGGEHMYKNDTRMSTDTNKMNFKRGIRKIKKLGGDPYTETWALDIFASKKYGTNVKRDMCPCLTKSRCQAGGYYFTNRGCVQSLESMLRLQGVPPKRLKKPSNVSAPKFRGMVGNAMSVPVVGRILFNQFKAIGFLKGNTDDPWATFFV